MAKIIINHEGEKYPIANVSVESINSSSVSLKFPKSEFTSMQMLDYVRRGIIRSTYCYTDSYSASVDISMIEDIAD